MGQDRNLYKATTNGCGEFYVVATSFDRASQLIEEELNKQNYGFSDGRKVMQVNLIRCEHYFSGERFFCGDNDINKLIIDDSDRITSLELHFTEKLEQLTKQNDKLREKLSRFQSTDAQDIGD